jgi:HEAT repeat protein
LLLSILVLILRARLLIRERRRRKFLSVWQPILMKSIEAASSDVPQLDRRDLLDFLLLWNHLHESLLDEAKDHLNQTASSLSIDQTCLQMLRGNLRERLLAIVTLGHLREFAAWDELSRITQNEDALLSVAAARALVMIDASKAVPQLIPLLARRPDWTASSVARVLKTAGANAISDPIACAAIASAMEDTKKIPDREREAINYTARLIHYLDLAHDTSALPAAHTIAESSHDPEVLAACLRLLNRAEDLEIIRGCLTHEDWRVRVQAAVALGRVGVAEDEGRLIPLLSDKQWWVRYRAGQALSRLPRMREPRLKVIQTEQSDPFARDMLAQVMAEIELQ